MLCSNFTKNTTLFLAAHGERTLSGIRAIANMCHTVQGEQQKKRTANVALYEMDGISGNHERRSEAKTPGKEWRSESGTKCR